MHFQVGDLVILRETVEWDDLIGVKGEICIIVSAYGRTSLDDGIFFDYKICTADGVSLDVWEGEIEGIQKDEF